MTDSNAFYRFRKTLIFVLVGTGLFLYFGPSFLRWLFVSKGNSYGKLHFIHLICKLENGFSTVIREIIVLIFRHTEQMHQRQDRHICARVP